MGYLGAGLFCWTTSIMGRAAFCSQWDRHSLYIFSFSAYKVYAKTTIHGLMEWLILCHGIPYTITSDEGSLCIEIKSGNGTMLIEFTSLLIEFTSLTLPSSLPKSTGLTKWWNGFLKNYLWYQLSGLWHNLCS